MPEFTPEEIAKIHEEVDEDIAKNGIPSEEDIEAEIKELNKNS